MLVRYPSPVAASEQYRLFINGQSVDVYDTPVHFGDKDWITERDHPHIASFAYFDTDEPAVTVRIEPLLWAPEKAEVSPKSRGIEYRIVNGGIEFAMPAPDQISVIVNGQDNRNLMIFANPIEQDSPNPDDENVIYFGPGEHVIDNEDKTIHLQSGQTLYLAGGAYVHGHIETDHTTDISIVGRGIISGEHFVHWHDAVQDVMGIPRTKRKIMCKLDFVQRGSLEGIILVNTPTWTIRLMECDDMWIENLKLIGYGANSDGIDICNSCNVTARNTFIRTGDDGFVIKGMGRGISTHSCLNIDIGHSTVWADRASALEIGHETCMSAVAHIHFHDIDILHQDEDTYGYHSMDITSVDGANIYDVLFEDIRVEHCVRFFGARLQTSVWATSGQHGTIRDVTLRNIHCDGNTDMDLFGWDAQHDIRDITLENIYFGGQPLTQMPSVFVNPYVHDVMLLFNGEVCDLIMDTYPEDLEMEPICIEKAANVTLSGSEAPLGLAHAYWDGYEAGEVNQFGAKFMVLGDEKGKKAIVPGERLGKDSVAIKIDEECEYLFFLVTAARVNGSWSPIHTRFLTLEATYEDGAKLSAPVAFKADCDAWDMWSLAGWQPLLGEMRTYVVPFANPRPEEKIAEVRILDGETGEIPVVLAVSKA